MAHNSTSADDIGYNDDFLWSRSYIRPGIWWVNGLKDLSQATSYAAVTDDFGNLVRVPV